MQFYSSIAETLFEPLPTSLWTDYYRDRDTGDGSGNHTETTRNSQSPQRTILPSACHFQSLPRRSDEMCTDDDENDDDGSANTTSSSITLGSSPVVKSLFHDGCLFAYSNPGESHDAIYTNAGAGADASPRARKRTNASLSPLPRRFQTRINPPPLSPDESSFMALRKNSHRFRY